MRTLFALLLLASSAQAQMTPAKLLQLDRSFEKATSEKHLDGWMAYITDTTVIFGPQHYSQLVAGKEEIQKYYSNLFANSGFSMEWHPGTAELLPTKATGYTRGTFHWVIPNERCSCKNDWRGSYIAVWEEEGGPEGPWKLMVLIPSLANGSTMCGCGS